MNERVLWTAWHRAVTVSWPATMAAIVLLLNNNVSADMVTFYHSVSKQLLPVLHLWEAVVLHAVLHAYVLRPRDPIAVNVIFTLFVLYTQLQTHIRAVIVFQNKILDQTQDIFCRSWILPQQKEEQHTHRHFFVVGEN